MLAAHEILRTAFVERQGEVLQRAVAVKDPRLAGSVTVEQLESLSSPEAHRRLEALAAADILQPFDLAVAPLLRARICRMPGNELQLLVTAHHIVADGLCVELIRDYLAAGKAARRECPSPSDPGRT